MFSFSLFFFFFTNPNESQIFYALKNGSFNLQNDLIWRATVLNTNLQKIFVSFQLKWLVSSLRYLRSSDRLNTVLFFKKIYFLFKTRRHTHLSLHCWIYVYIARVFHCKSVSFFQGDFYKQRQSWTIEKSVFFYYAVMFAQWIYKHAASLMLEIWRRDASVNRSRNWTYCYIDVPLKVIEIPTIVKESKY